MADVQSLLKKILSAVKGEDVRGSIHDAIKQCYYDGKAGGNDLEARDRAAAAEARIALLEASGEGGTTSDEVRAIRVANDGTTHSSAAARLEADFYDTRTIEVATKEPTRDNTAMWINPNDRESFCLPEIKDDELSNDDTWSSEKISSECSAGQGMVNGLHEPIKFDTVNNTITIPRYIYISRGLSKPYHNLDADITIDHDFDAETGQMGLYFDIETSTFGVGELQDVNTVSNKYIILATWWKRLCDYENKCTLRSRYSYTIDGKKYDNYGDIFDSQSISLANLTAHGNMALVVNAFGDPINFDFKNRIITIPRHCIINCGGRRLTYNGEAPIEIVLSEDLSGERSLVFDLDTKTFVVTANMNSIFYPNSLLVATWWNETLPKSIVCTSRYTINGEQVDGYNNPLAGDTFIEVTGKTLIDKKVLVIGDSISTDYYGNYEKWVTKLINKNYFAADNVTNDSIHATGFIATYKGGDDFYTRIQNVTNKDAYDLVIIFGGINDYIQGVPVADFKTAVDTFFSYVVDNFANARICVLSPLRTNAMWENAAGETQQTYTDYIKTVSKSYCLPTLNLTDESGFCPFIESFKDRWTLMPDGYDVTDGVHPTEEYGEKYLAPMIEGFLSSII